MSSNESQQEILADAERLIKAWTGLNLLDALLQTRAQSADKLDEIGLKWLEAWIFEAYLQSVNLGNQTEAHNLLARWIKPKTTPVSKPKTPVRTSAKDRQKHRDLKAQIEEITHARPDQLRDGYLNRLRRLLRLRRDHFGELNEQGLRLLDRSIFAAYCDCLDIGQGEAASAVLKDVRLTLSLPRSQ